MERRIEVRGSDKGWADKTGNVILPPGSIKEYQPAFAGVQGDAIGWYSIIHPDYCSQPHGIDGEGEGGCNMCSLSNYGRDCHNNPI